MLLAPSLQRLGTETAFEVLARAGELQAQGRDIINLGIGQPDFKTPAHIVEAAIKALRDGHHGYTPANGILRRLGRGRTPMTSLTAYVEQGPETQLYVGVGPGLPGAHSQAGSLDELRANLEIIGEAAKHLSASEKARRADVCPGGGWPVSVTC